MKSLFVKHFTIYALVIVISFMSLGGAFVNQINRYALDEKKAALEVACVNAAYSTASFVETYMAFGQVVRGSALERRYLGTMEQHAKDASGIIFVGDGEGNLLIYATDEGAFPQESGRLPAAAVAIVRETGVYDEIGTFYGYVGSAHFIRGTAIFDMDSNIIAQVFVAVPADSSIRFFLNITSTFLVMTFVVLLATLAITYVVAMGMVRPLRQMAGAARAFAQGDFSVRVPLPSRQDELYGMTLSFNRMADSIENTELLRRGLIANVSHDLRTPMTTISGFIDGILDGTIKEDKRDYYLRIVSEEIKRLSRMATGMLEVSRLESGERGLNKAAFDFSEMIRRIVIGFEQKINEKGIKLTLDIPDTLNLTADHDGMFQAVYNLFDNAVKFTPDEGQISIHASAKGGRLQFNIINTGSSIPPDSLKHIFERFYKSDASRSMNQTGSGLGLYIVKTCVNRHGGDIYAKSEGDQTEFCFTIPM